MIKDKIMVGRVEKVQFPTLGNAVLYARIDTGARTSSIWASSIEETDEGLLVRFASPDHEAYQHQQLFAHYDRVTVVSSMGQCQVRYKVKMSVIIRGRRIKASFTLSDRSKQVYPVLVGRSILAGKFIVDVQKGSPLLEAEARQSAKLQAGVSITEEHI